MNGIGGLGVKMKCRACETDLDRDPETGNYFCPKPGCGKGRISSPDGITTTVDEAGNVTLSSKGGPS